MAAPRTGFIADCVTQIGEMLRIADAWSALKAEFDTFTANNVAITQEQLNTIFGTDGGDPPVPNVTVPQFNAALGAQQEVVDHVHVATRAAKLYRVRR